MQNSEVLHIHIHHLYNIFNLESSIREESEKFSRGKYHSSANIFFPLHIYKFLR